MLEIISQIGGDTYYLKKKIIITQVQLFTS